MALESLFDTPPPLVSKGNNDTDKPANDSVSEEIRVEVSADIIKEKDGASGDAPAEELEDGEIDEDSEDEEKDEDKDYSDYEDLDAEELKRRKKRIKNKVRRKRKKEEKRMQALQAWAMAMAAGEIGDQDEGEDDDMASEEEEEETSENKPVPLMSKPLDEMPVKLQSPHMERSYSPKKKKAHKRPRVLSPMSDSDEEEYAKLLRKEMSRHKLKRKSSAESSSDDRRDRSPVRYESEGPRRHEEGRSEEEDDFDSSHRSKRKKRKKHKHHHRSKRSKSKSRRNTVQTDEENENTMEDISTSRQQMHQSIQEQPQFEQEQKQQQFQQQQQQQQLTEQDHQIMMDQEMGKRHIPKTHLICKFYLEHKCKKGLDCSYTHEGKIPKRLEQCKFYLQGFCSKGPLCMFLHQEYPCKYFHTGQVCYSGEKCRFSHKPLTEELKPLVEMLRNEQGHSREGEQPPLLPSPDKHTNVPFQRGNPGGKPPKGGVGGGVGSIPSLFDLNVKPVGEKGQRILETERLEAQDIKFERISFFGADEEEPRNHDGPASMSSQNVYHNPPEIHKNSEPTQGQILSSGEAPGNTNAAVTVQEPPLLPTPLPLIPEIPVEFQPPHPSTLLPLSLIVPQPGGDVTVEKSKDLVQEAAPSDKLSESTPVDIKSTDTTMEDVNHVSDNTSKKQVTALENSTDSDLIVTDLTSASEAEDPNAETTNKTDAGAKKVVKPPVSMPAKSKALFMRIQQNQVQTNAASNVKGDAAAGKKKEMEADDNWYSSDEEDPSRKKGNHSEKERRSIPNTTLKVNVSKTSTISEPSAISPEASNKGPLMSSVLMANNKQTEAHLAQSQLPGPLASLFSQSPSGAAAITPPHLPLNILDLVTKGTSSIQKSTNPQVQDLFAGILPRKGVNDGYRLLECIRDPHRTDPREGRERRSKVGMLFRVLKWKSSEYSISDMEERPRLPPIELTTPTEMKSQPVFPNSDPRTQAVVDALKKVIDEARAKPSDPRNQRLIDPRTQQQLLQNPSGFPPTNFVQGQLPAIPIVGPLPLFSPNHQQQQQPPPIPGQPGAPGPGFMRLPMRPPNQSYPPHMPRPPQGVPTGYTTPRYASRGPRGPRPIRPEFGQRMQHRPTRPLLRPPFGSPQRPGPPPMERMTSPRDPRFGNTRLAAPEAVSLEGHGDTRDPRATNRGPAALDPRLVKRNSILSTPPPDIDMRVVKDPRLARMQEQTTASTGIPTTPVVQRFPKQGDVDMRQVAVQNMLGKPRPLTPTDGFSTYNENTLGQTRGRLDPRQAVRAPIIPKDIDLRQRPMAQSRAPDSDPVQSGEAVDSDIPLKDMFKGRDPTASPFL